MQPYLISLDHLQFPKVQAFLGREGLSTGGSTDSIGPGQRTQDIGVTQTWIHTPCLPLSAF